jgi:hypothetical protein
MTPGPSGSSTDPNPIIPINPPKSLLSLPKELLTEVCSLLDRKDAISLLYVHRSLHQSAESRIYRDITLSIPTYWGEPVLIRPEGSPYGTNSYCTWAKKQALQVENAGRAEARRRVEEMIKVLSRGTERWRYVRKVVIEPRVGANNAILQFLSLAREHVSEIEIITSRKHIFRDQWQPVPSQTIWAKLLDFDIGEQFDFPNLSTIKVALEGYDCSSSPLALIHLAKGLQHLEVVGGKTEGMEICEEERCPCYIADISYVSFAPIHLQTLVYRGDLDPDGCGSRLLSWVGTTHVTDLTFRIGQTGDLGLDWDHTWLPDVMNGGDLRRLDLRLGHFPLAAILNTTYFSDPDVEVGDPDNQRLRILIQYAPNVEGSATERLDVRQESSGIADAHLPVRHS